MSVHGRKGDGGGVGGHARMGCVCVCQSVCPCLNVCVYCHKRLCQLDKGYEDVYRWDRTRKCVCTCVSEGYSVGCCGSVCVFEKGGVSDRGVKEETGCRHDSSLPESSSA